MVEGIDWEEAGTHFHWCRHHGRIEPEAGAFLICSECWHVYRTEKALRRMFDKIVIGQRWWKKSSTVKIYVCPLCGHDISRRTK